MLEMPHFVVSLWDLWDTYADNVLISACQAKNSGKFSNEELLSLKREFQHHKDKIHEYNILMDTISRTEGELHKIFPLALNQSTGSL